MKTNRLALIIFSLFLIGIMSSLLGQEVLFKKKNFRDQKDAYKVAEKHLKAADKFMESVPFPMYQKALDEYLKAQSFNPKSARVNYNIGLCYLHSVKKFSALKYFQNAFHLNPKMFPDIQYKLGRGYHLNMKWKSAIEHYRKYQMMASRNGNREGVLKAKKRIKECKSGEQLVKDTVRVWIDDLGKNLNTKYPEYGMIITADATEIYFTSRRPNTTGGIRDPYDGEFKEDIYTSHWTPNGWSPAQNVGSPVNTKEHDAAVALSPSGQRMLVYKDDKGDGNIYESIQVGNFWSKPKKLDKAISSQYHESAACYSPDGRKLYFVSNRPQIKGNAPHDHDIFVASWNSKKHRWDNVQRLPSNVNTAYDENSVYMHPDGKTLYFSSKGHNSMGGYDVFKTVHKDDGTWTNPVNMGYPINTPDDDVFFVVAANKRDAYMTSYRKGGFGGNDLYKVTLLGPEKEPILKGGDILLANAAVPVQSATVQPKVKVKSKVLILKGTIYDAETKKPIQAQIEIVDNEKNQTLANFQSNSKSGRYLVALPGGKNYGIAVKAEGYLFHSENFNVTDSKGYKEVKKDIYLKKVHVGKSIVLRNIFFDFDKATLRPESKVELERLIDLLTKNPTLKVEISGYTDSRGSESYNLKLSQERAQSVVNYLVKHGIDKPRLTAKGYGPHNPIVSDEEIAKMERESAREAAYQKNRRTEFKILSK